MYVCRYGHGDITRGNVNIRIPDMYFTNVELDSNFATANENNSHVFYIMTMKYLKSNI
jgi:hypothetical protein